MKKAYISGITNDSFLLGVVIMFNSLKSTSYNSKIELVCFVTENVSENSKAVLKKIGCNVIMFEKMNHLGDGRWGDTFQKINIFSLCEYDKLVWIDADMLIVNNIDMLFNKKSVSAVKTRSLIPTDKSRFGFNSGIMVIEPHEDLSYQIEAKIESVSKKHKDINIPIGDQNVLNEYYDKWYLSPDLHLRDSYNVFWGSIEDYIDDGYRIQESDDKCIYVIHYTGRHKPWQYSTWFVIKSYIRCLRYKHRLSSCETLKIMSLYKDNYKVAKEILKSI